MKLRLALLSALLLPLSMQAATISIINTCNPPTGSPVSGSANCSVLSSSGGFPPGASASATVTLMLAANSSAFSNFFTQFNTYANGYEGFPVLQWYPAYAGSIVMLDTTLITAGPIRSGYIQLNVSGGLNVGSGDNGGGERLMLSNPGNGMSLGVSCTTLGPSCSSYISQNTFPFELGVAFPISYTGNAFSNSFSIVDGPGSASVSLNYSFRFFEADGITPVVVSETPEPSTSVLLVPALIWLAVIRHQRKERKQLSSTRIASTA